MKCFGSDCLFRHFALVLAGTLKFIYHSGDKSPARKHFDVESLSGSSKIRLCIINLLFDYLMYFVQL